MERTANDLKAMAKEINAEAGEVKKSAKTVKAEVKKVQATAKIDTQLKSIATRSYKDFFQHLKNVSPELSNTAQAFYKACCKFGLGNKDSDRFELSVNGAYLLVHPRGNRKDLAGQADK